MMYIVGILYYIICNILLKQTLITEHLMNQYSDLMVP